MKVVQQPNVMASSIAVADPATPSPASTQEDRPYDTIYSSGDGEDLQNIIYDGSDTASAKASSEDSYRRAPYSVDSASSATVGGYDHDDRVPSSGEALTFTTADYAEPQCSSSEGEFSAGSKGTAQS